MAKDYNPDYQLFPSEFRSDGDMYKLFQKNGLELGRMISWSKSSYRESHPDNLVIFNSNILTKKRGKVWHGDLDVTEDYDALQNIADELGENLYVLREMDARFGNENLPIKSLIKKAAATISPSKAVK